MEPIIFNLDLDNKPIKDVITKENIDKLMFSEQYKSAFKQIEQYLTALTSNNDLKSEGKLGKEDYDYFDIDYNNNIFAFVGERGTGKTSCMISVADLLCDNKRKASFDEYESMKKVNFETIDLIDPSYFDSTHNVISLFLAKLYGSYKQHIEKCSFNCINEDARSKFLEKLSNAQKHLMQFDQNVKDSNLENSIEQLVSLAAAIDLKRDIRELVDGYNEVLGLKDSILILRIDDIDINTANSAKMAEYIRKYFVQPNMIVLMSLKLEQLEAIKRNEFKETYKNIENEVDVSDMAAKYINKLIPQSQRIYMPKPTNYLSKPLKIESVHTKEDLSFPSIKEAVPALIFKKTRYLFYNTDIQSSRIIPRNLRDLRQIVKMLCLMPDYKESDTAYNKEIFKNYFYNSWLEQHVNRNDQHYLREIIGQEDAISLNSKIIEVLEKKFSISPKSSITTNGSLEAELENILSSKNFSYNVSTGDVLGLINLLESRYQSPQDMDFLFFIRSFYSIKLYEAYDDVTDGIKNYRKDDSAKLEKKSNGIVNRRARLSNLNSYSRLTGGALFNYVLTHLVPNNNEGSQLLISRELYAQKLIDLMKRCLDDWDGAKTKHLIELTEFFMLGIAGNSDSQNSNYRTYSEVYYNSGKMGDTLTFNLYSLFYNLTQLCSIKGRSNDGTITYQWPCYERFLNLQLDSKTVRSFISKLLEHDSIKYKLWSHILCSSIIHKQNDDYKTVDKCDPEDMLNVFELDRLLSYVSFRNTEVMQDFVQFMSEGSYDTTKPFIAFRDFFERLGEYNIRTYDRDGDSPYEISFAFADDFLEIFKDDTLKDEFYTVFGKPNKAGSETKSVDNNAPEQSSGNVGNVEQG